jgi:hypothetical protein
VRLRIEKSITYATGANNWHLRFTIGMVTPDNEHSFQFSGGDRNCFIGSCTN